eukprot:1194592-Prorocentrum_minimum.AAC.11
MDFTLIIAVTIIFIIVFFGENNTRKNNSTISEVNSKTSEVNSPPQTSQECEGSWSAWVERSPCTATCANPDGGTKVMIRTYEVPPTSSDVWCPGFSNGYIEEDTVECSIDPDLCPCEGSWSAWVERSPCTATCAIPTGTKDMIRTYEVPPTSSDVWCPGFSNGYIEEDTVECSIDPDLCPCEGSWSAWVDSSPCTATCENPDGTKEMTQTFTVPDTSSDVWCPDQNNGDTIRDDTVQCRVDPMQCVRYHPYRLKSDMLLQIINETRQSQDVTKEECVQNCFDNADCKSYVYCDNFPGLNAPNGIIYGPAGFDMWGSCLHFDKSIEHVIFLGYAPSLQELLIMPESESDALKESHLVGCALVEMDKPVNNEVIACEGRWEAIGECIQPCDGTQTFNSGRQHYRFRETQWRENGGNECEAVNGQEKTEPCDVGCPTPPPPPIQIPQDIENLFSNLESEMNPYINSYLPISDYPTGDITELVDLGYGQTNRDGTGHVDIDANGHKFLKPSSKIGQNNPFNLSSPYFTFVIVFKPVPEYVLMSPENNTFITNLDSDANGHSIRLVLCNVINSHSIRLVLCNVVNSHSIRLVLCSVLNIRGTVSFGFRIV